MAVSVLGEYTEDTGHSAVQFSEKTNEWKLVQMLVLGCESDTYIYRPAPNPEFRSASQGSRMESQISFIANCLYLDLNSITFPSHV